MTDHTPEGERVRVSETISVPGRCRATAGVWAAAGIVVIETDDGKEMTDAHLTPAKAREYARHIFTQADLAETFARDEKR